jgi:hypothetical protein
MFRRFSVVVSAIASIAALVGTGVAQGRDSSTAAPGGPPHGVWTCGYIAAHPTEAAAALVSCDARGPVGGSLSAMRLRPSGATSQCNRVPQTGAVGTGVFAWSVYHSFNTFSQAPAVIESFTWYIQKTDGTNVQNGTTSTANSYNVNTGTGTYRFGAQNHGPTAQSWTFCWGT